MKDKCLTVVHIMFSVRPPRWDDLHLLLPFFLVDMPGSKFGYFFPFLVWTNFVFLSFSVLSGRLCGRDCEAIRRFLVLLKLKQQRKKQELCQLCNRLQGHFSFCWF